MNPIIYAVEYSDDSLAALLLLFALSLPILIAKGFLWLCERPAAVRKRWSPVEVMR